MRSTVHVYKIEDSGTVHVYKIAYSSTSLPPSRPLFPPSPQPDPLATTSEPLSPPAPPSPQPDPLATTSEPSALSPQPSAPPPPPPLPDPSAMRTSRHLGRPGQAHAGSTHLGWVGAGPGVCVTGTGSMALVRGSAGDGVAWCAYARLAGVCMGAGVAIVAAGAIRLYMQIKASSSEAMAACIRPSVRVGLHTGRVRVGEYTLRGSTLVGYEGSGPRVHSHSTGGFRGGSAWGSGVTQPRFSGVTEPRVQGCVPCLFISAVSGQARTRQQHIPWVGRSRPRCVCRRYRHPGIGLACR